MLVPLALRRRRIAARLHGLRGARPSLDAARSLAQLAPPSPIGTCSADADSCVATARSATPRGCRAATAQTCFWFGADQPCWPGPLAASALAAAVFVSTVSAPALRLAGAAGLARRVRPALPATPAAPVLGGRLRVRRRLRSRSGVGGLLPAVWRGRWLRRCRLRGRPRCREAGWAAWHRSTWPASGARWSAGR